MPEGSRRAFLGAAAATMALSGEVSADAPESSELVEDRRVTDGGDYVVTECGSVPGELGEVDVWGESWNDPIEITATYAAEGWSGVGVLWNAGPVRVDTSLEPDDARELAERLKVAADAAEGEADA